MQFMIMSMFKSNSVAPMPPQIVSMVPFNNSEVIKNDSNILSNVSNVQVINTRPSTNNNESIISVINLVATTPATTKGFGINISSPDCNLPLTNNCMSNKAKDDKSYSTEPGDGNVLCVNDVAISEESPSGNTRNKREKVQIRSRDVFIFSETFLI
jgi:hypothetical protein